MSNTSSSARKIGAHVSAAGGPSKAVNNALSIGANCFQIFAGSPRTWKRSLYDQSEVDRFNQLVDQNNLRPVFIHALYLVNLASDNPETLDKSLQSLLVDLQNGDQINAAGVIVHLGSHQGRGLDSVKSQLVQKINLLLNQTKSTPLLIENSSGQKGKVGLLTEIETLLSQISSDRLQVCLDTAHLFEAGYDLNNTKQTDQLIKELEQRNILPRLTCLHLNDSKTPLGSARDQHHNLGQGHISLTGLKHLVNHPQLKHLPLILEVPGFNSKGPDQQNIQIAQSLTHT